MTGLTVFQKACVAAGTAGSAGGAAFAYAVRRHVDDAEYRVWLRKASPMVADQVDQFLVDLTARSAIHRFGLVGSVRRARYGVRRVHAERWW